MSIKDRIDELEAKIPHCSGASEELELLIELDDLYYKYLNCNQGGEKSEV